MSSIKKFWGSVPGQRYLPPPQSPDRLPSFVANEVVLLRRQFDRGMIPTNHVHLVLRSRMRGAVTPLRRLQGRGA
jgi:hypothetical protein